MSQGIIGKMTSKGNPVSKKWAMLILFTGTKSGSGSGGDQFNAT
jgi:hypothetical protein